MSLNPPVMDVRAAGLTAEFTCEELYHKGSFATIQSTNLYHEGSSLLQPNILIECIVEHKWLTEV